MKQIQFTYTNDVRLDTELRKIRQWYNSSLTPTILFQIYTEGNCSGTLNLKPTGYCQL